MSKPRGERFRLVVEVLPDEGPSRIRLRAFLKRALRSFKIRCLSITPPMPLALRLASRETPRRPSGPSAAGDGPSGEPGTIGGGPC